MKSAMSPSEQGISSKLRTKREKRPEIRWKALVSIHFGRSLKPPFNDSARLAAGLSRSFYGTLA